MAYHFRNLVFEGGGVKGIAYVGATEVLEKKGILPSIARVGGTSAGAINALLVGLNYSPTETKQILSQLDFQSFLDDEWGVIRDTNRLLTDYGWYTGVFSDAGSPSALRSRPETRMLCSTTFITRRSKRGSANSSSSAPTSPPDSPRSSPRSTPRTGA